MKESIILEIFHNKLEEMHPPHTATIEEITNLTAILKAATTPEIFKTIIALTDAHNKDLCHQIDYYATQAFKLAFQICTQTLQ